ncbi:MAG: MBL fold metallo-hydrolase [Actinomycetota bacterium]|nr:MBL fold metallo-hydrolase [Actinomycetota bacterium]
MIYKILEVGPLGANCIIAWDKDTKKGIVADPGDEPDRISELIKTEQLQISHIVCTHAHFDHIGAVSDLKAETGAVIAVHEAEMEIYYGARDQAALWGYELADLPKPDLLLKDGDNITSGGITFKVIHTPGHSPGGVCLYGQGILITGDTLFAGSIGRTDFYGGDSALIMESLRKLAALPGSTVVLPGHGPATNMAREIKTNVFYQELRLK